MAQINLTKLDVTAVTGKPLANESVTKIDIFAIVNTNPPPPPPPPVRRKGAVHVISWRRPSS